MATEHRAPLLLPQNRKLRHLEGIWLRNLSFARPKGRTTDDVALNTSPSKMGALHDGTKLHHALSSESLRPKARRRASTLTQDTPFSEQKKLQAMYDSWIADAFFSLHCEGADDPVYVSEKQERKTVCCLPQRITWFVTDHCLCRTSISSRSISGTTAAK